MHNNYLDRIGIVREGLAGLRILGQVLAGPRAFTPQSLCRDLQLPMNTVQSWLQRHDEWFEAWVASQDLALHRRPRGRPAQYRQLRADMRLRAEAELRKAYNASAPFLAASDRGEVGLGVDPFGALTTAEKRDAELRAAENASLQNVVGHDLESLRTLLRLAWEEVEDLVGAGAEPSAPVLRRITSLEARFEGAFGFDALHTAQEHIKHHFKTSADRGWDLGFSGAVILARAQTAKQTHVLVGAGLIGTADGAPRLAEWLSPWLTPVEIFTELDRFVSFLMKEDFQIEEKLAKLLYGITADPTLNVSSAAARWVLALQMTGYWSPLFAPAAIQLLADAENFLLPRIVSLLKDDLSILFGEGKARPILVPSAVWDFAGRFNSYASQAVPDRVSHKRLSTEGFFQLFGKERDGKRKSVARGMRKRGATDGDIHESFRATRIPELLRGSARSSPVVLAMA